MGARGRDAIANESARAALPLQTEAASVPGMRMSRPLADGTTISMELESSWGPTQITAELPNRVANMEWPAAPDWTADAALAAGLLPAMRRGEMLDIDGFVSPRLLEGAATVQDIFCTWDRTLRPTSPWYQRVHVSVKPGEPDPSTPCQTEDQPRRTASFFTGGVDSFFTAHRHRAGLCALVYVEGFDVPLENGRLRSTVREHLAAAADEMGLELVVVASNLRALGTAAGVNWPDQHGSALACIAHLLGPWFDRVLIPATHTYAHLEGLGSHPLLDPLWSSDRLEIRHDGAHATRVDKLRALAELPAARAHLRVCWENREGAYNCGRCEKCVRTSAAARAAGVGHAFPTLPAAPLRRVVAARATGRGSAWEDIRADLARTGGDPHLRRAVGKVLLRHQQLRSHDLRKRYRTP